MYTTLYNYVDEKEQNYPLTADAKFQQLSRETAKHFKQQLII